MQLINIQHYVLHCTVETVKLARVQPEGQCIIIFPGINDSLSSMEFLSQYH